MNRGLLSSSSFSFRRSVFLRKNPSPANVLAARFGKSADAVHKHLKVLQKAGVLRVTHGRLYGFTARFQPHPETGEIDLDSCVLHLNLPPQLPPGELRRRAEPGSGQSWFPLVPKLQLGHAPAGEALASYRRE